MTTALVIDDNKQTMEVLINMLRFWDITTRPALGPGAAMTILQQETPGVIFLDLNMPGINGFEILPFLQKEKRLEKVPVIVVTSDDQPETKERALKGGAHSIILKPVMLDELENTLRGIGII